MTTGTCPKCGALRKELTVVSRAIRNRPKRKRVLRCRSCQKHYILSHRTLAGLVTDFTRDLQLRDRIVPVDHDLKPRANNRKNPMDLHRRSNTARDTTGRRRTIHGIGAQ